MSSVAAHFLDDNGTDRLDGTLVTYTPIVSGALPTVSLSSGTAAQVSTSRDVTAAIALTTDGTNAAATTKIELSPDNSTFSTLATISYAAAINNTGAIVFLQTLRVPAAWWIKVTVSHTAITSTTYF